MYFALASMMRLFHHLHYGLSLILVFIGGKILLESVVPIPMPVALGVVGGLLVLSVAASLLWPKKTRKPVSISKPVTITVARTGNNFHPIALVCQ